MRLLLISAIVLGALPVTAQTDTLQSKSGIEAYLKKSYRYNTVKLHAVNSVVKDTTVIPPTQPQYWLKADFNHDGKDDYLISATTQQGNKSENVELFILASHNKLYTKVNIDNRHYSDTPQSSYETYSNLNHQYLVITSLSMILPRLENGDWTRNFIYKIHNDTLFIMNDKPMIYNSHPSKKAVNSIKFLTTQCFGTCPIFELAINNNGSTIYNGINFVKRLGNFNLILNKSEFIYLMTLISNIDPYLLRDEYEVDHTDDQTAYLTINYVDGSTKKIADYGLQGTYGLATLYSFLFSLINF